MTRPMTRDVARAGAALLLAAGLGTAGPSRRAAFAPVGREIEFRVGAPAPWGAAAPAGAAEAEAVDRLLARPLTQEAAVTVALLRQPELQAAFEDLGVARAELHQAGLLKNPSLGFETKYLPGGPGHTTELELVQDVIDLAFRGARRRIGRAGLEAARARAVGAAIDLAAEAREAWVRAVAEEELLGLRRQVLEAVGASYEVARRLHLAGNLHDADRSQEEALYEAARLDVLASEAARTAALEELAGTLGVWGAGALLRLPGELPGLPGRDPDPAGLELQALEVSVDLAAAAKDREAAARERAMTRRIGSLPRLALGVAAEREDHGDWSFGPALDVGLPLFDRGQARAEGAAARVRRAEAMQAGLGIRIRALVRAGATRLAGARQRAAHLEAKVLPLRARLVEEMQLRYNAMAVGVFQLLAAKRDQILAGQQLIEAKRDYWLARIALDALGQGRVRATPAAPGPAGSAAAGTEEAGAH